jgi:hypothetical protein
MGQWSGGGAPRPGAAQPAQPPSQGSPYPGTRPIDDGLLPVGGTGGPAWSQSPASPPSGQYAGRYMAGVTPEYMAAYPDALPPPSPQGPKQTFQMGGGNLAYAAPDQRPQPFTQSSSFGGMSGTPEQMGNLRGAFVQSINNSRAPQAAQWGMGNYQAPSRDFGQMMGRAQDMVEGGWQNPLQGLFGRK